MGNYSFHTVLGEIDENKLGFTQPHEHVYIVRTVDQRNCELTCINNLPRSAGELLLFRRAGGNTVVDANPLATGRDVLGLQDIARLSGVNIIATTGYHIPKFYPEGHWIFNIPGEELSEMFVREIEEGMFLDGCYVKPEYQTHIKAGLIKSMITKQGLSDPWTVKCITAAGKAALASGASIMIHTEGVDELEMIDLLAGKIGLPAEKILVCHVDRDVTDLEKHRMIAKTGVFMEYDTITLFQFHSNAEEVRMLRFMIEEGFLDRILLSTDPETNRMHCYGGTVGIDYILTHFIPLLKLNGFTENELNRIFRENPRRALAIRK